MLAGAAAIGTKDQAYGFYVLPALVVVIGSIRHARTTPPPAGVPSLRLLCGMAALAIAAVAVFNNVFFNFQGFVEHLRIITGPGSQNFRMYAYPGR